MSIKDYTAMVDVEVREVTGISSNFNDFVGAVDFEKVDKASQWQDAYFSLLSWKNTWRIPYEMDIESTYDHIPFLHVVVNTDNADALVDFMETLGYGNIKRHNFKVGIVEIPLDDEEECFDFYLE